MFSLITSRLRCRAISQAFRFPTWVPLDSGTQPGRSPRTTNFIRPIVITSEGGSDTTGSHVEPWPLQYCAPNVALVSLGRQDWAALKPHLCSAQTLELYQSAIQPYERCVAQTKHLDSQMTVTKRFFLVTLSSIHRQCAKIQSLPVGWVTNLCIPLWAICKFLPTTPV